MKKLLLLFILLSVMLLPVYASEVKGFLYQNTTEYLVGTNIKMAEKTGKATCTQIFGVVAMGDCSVSKAMTNGDIKLLSHADKHIINILGIRRVETYVYGE